MKLIFLAMTTLVLLAACAPQATPTAVPTPTSSPSVTPSATASPSTTPTPSSTLTSTPLPTSTRTPTVTRTSLPTRTQTPSATPTPAQRYSMVTLREPQDGRSIEGISVTFEWEPMNLQLEGDHYEVFIRRAQNPTWEKKFNAGGQLKLPLAAEQALSFGDYVWNVFVVDAPGNVVSADGGSRKLTWCHKGSYCHECSSCHH